MIGYRENLLWYFKFFLSRAFLGQDVMTVSNFWQHLCTEDIRCFTFLAGDIIMMATIFNQTEACLEVYDLNPAPGRPNFLRAFCLPKGGRDSAVIDLSISSDASSWPRGPLAPFSVSLEDKLFTVTYETLAETSENSLKALLCIPMSTILDHLDKPWVDDMEQEIDWKEWGPSGAHFISLDRGLSDVWICHTYGMKFVLAKPSPEGHIGSIRLYNFNKLSAKRDCLSPGNTTRALTSPSVILASAEMFAEPVHTHLPCRCSWRDLVCEDTKYEAVMMSEDSLIAVASDRRMLTVFTF